MDTNYRNAREIFDYARRVILPVVPDADIPNAVRETGIDPREMVIDGSVERHVGMALEELLQEVDGSIAIIPPTRWHDRLRVFDGDQGPGVGCDDRARSGGHRAGVTRRRARPLRGAHPRRAPDVGPPPAQPNFCVTRNLS